MRQRRLALLAVLALVSVAAAPSPSPAPAAAPSDQQRLVEDVRSEFSASLAAALAAQMRLSQTLQQNAQQQEALRQSLQASGARIAQLDASIAARQAQVDATQARIATERAEIGALARAIYRQPDSLVQRVAASGSLPDALTETGDLEAAGARGRQLKADLEHDVASLQAAQDQERADRQKEADLRAGLEQRLGQLQKVAQQEQQTAAALSDAIQRLRVGLSTAGGQPTDAAGRVAAELQAEEAQIAGAAEEETWTQVTLTNPGALTQPGLAGGPGAAFTWPLPDGVISQPFGPTDFGLEPAFGGFAHFHTGIDLVEPFGSPVLAAAGGVVVLVGGGTTGYGNYVVVAHAAGVTTLYGHLAVALVSPGQTVAQGQPIGLEGSTGNSTGPHLHFEVRVDGQPVDPMPFLPPRSS